MSTTIRFIEMKTIRIEAGGGGGRANCYQDLVRFIRSDMRIKQTLLFSPFGPHLYI